MLAYEHERDIVPAGCLIYAHGGTPAANRGARFAVECPVVMRFS
jgi:hypothetical protein